MPDVFVPLDTTKYTRFHRQLAAKGIVMNANLKYVDSHRKQLKNRYEAFDKYLSDFEIPQSVVNEIIAEGKKQKIEPKDAAELSRTLPYLKTQLKALVARDLWDMSEYFQVINEQNDIVLRAIEEMERQERQF